jgi:adenosylcobinamide kinase/adenosylcobinamide-phosphate guanylyltransferase
VIGGAASGKSAFAEKLVRQSGLAKTYVATAEPHDDDLRDKIALHRDYRAGHGWRTVEAPYETAFALAQIEAGEVALVDCITLWLWNQMRAGGVWPDELGLLCDVLAQLPAPTVLVTNEVGLAGAPEDPMAREFRSALGRVNQRLAALSDLVVQVTVGIPQVIKGHHLAEDEIWD